MEALVPFLVIVAVIVVGFLMIAGLVSARYQRVPPSEALVIYGRKKKRVITGGGTFVWPILESTQRLNLNVITITKKKDELRTAKGVIILVDWVAQVQISGEEEALNTAATAFLGKDTQQIHDIIFATLRGHVRGVVSKLTVEEVHGDRDGFVVQVHEQAAGDMGSMGVVIVSLNTEDISDPEGYLDSLANMQLAEIKEREAKAVAEADKASRIARAVSHREASEAEATNTEAAERAKLEADTRIKNEEQALRLRTVELEREEGLAQAAAEKEIQQERALAREQQEEADTLVPARAKRESDRIHAEAAQRVTEINAAAEAEKVKISAAAQAEAELKRATASANAELKKAQAEAEAIETTGKAEAAATEANLKAQAEGTREKLLAEAEGEREKAQARAAEGEINLRQFIIEELTKADIAKTEAVAEALAGLGNNVRIVQYGNGGAGGGSTGNTFMDMLLGIPEVADIFRTKVEAMSGEEFDVTMAKVVQLFNTLKTVDQPDGPANGQAQLQEASAKGD